ncbi:MAG: ribosome recycling factor [Chloroflexi bacterium]|nr:ribosome recycling factor [Chloroflexota bacterium]MCH8194865.1 ribosome recycling factor [Chloroflexota bacterium]MCH8283099.1 ribosome recycling factor [Chloroflexota bacterium]MCI0769099.1 ribosome recycling factor [Chloroflexota bacterium]
MIDDVLRQTEAKMKKSIAVLETEMASIRTGRASASLVDHITVDYYGNPTPLNQLATITVPEARVIAIQPWDKQTASPIEKAILKSDLGLNPVNDGTTIRLPIPLLTEERRKDLVKVVRRRIEDGKVAVRNVRRDGLESLRALEKNKEISQDEQKRAQDQLQKVTDTFVGQADVLGAKKETELMEV